MTLYGSTVSCKIVLAVSVIVTSMAFGSTERQKREAAFNKEMQNARLKYQWASVAPCTTAIRLYREIANSESAADTLRVQSLGALGEYYFSVKEYRKAVQMFQSAFKISKSNRYRHFWAMSLYQSGDDDSSRSLWHSLALEDSVGYSMISNFYTGLIYLKQGNFAAACSSFDKCGVPDIKRPLTIEALSAKYFCSIKLGRDGDARRYQQQLKTFKASMPVDWSTHWGVSSPQGRATTLHAGKAGLQANKFTVQVGAFGSRKNAYSLQKQISKVFKDVTVATVILDDKTFYRVRIGTFATRELAQQFVVDSVRMAGYSGKAVPQ